MRRIIFFILFILSLDIYAQNSTTKASESSNIKVKIQYQQNGSKIKGLTVLAKELQLFFVADPNQLKSYVEVPLLFERPGWTLYFGQKILSDSADVAKPITVPIYLKKELSLFSLRAVGPNGEVEVQNIYLKSQDGLERLKNRKEWDNVLLKLGLGMIDYYQEGSGAYKSIGTVFSAEYASAPQYWSGFGFYSKLSLNALPVWESPVKSGGQFLSLIGSGSYFFKTDEHDVIRHQLIFGGNYFQLFANSSPFGFNNLMTPHFGYRMHYFLESQNTVIVDAKYIAFGLPTQFKNFGISINSAYSFKTEKLNRMEIGFDFIYFQYLTPDNKKVKMNTMGLTFGYAL